MRIMMRFALLWVTIASLVGITISRHLPPGIFASDSRIQPAPKPVLDARSDTPPPPIASTAPDTPIGDGDETDEEENDIGLVQSASDELWYKHLRKGNSFNCGMRGTDAGAGWQIEDTRTPPSAASMWVGGLPQLRDWYWRENSFDARICDMDVYWGMGATFKALGISPRSIAAGGELQCFELRHVDEQAKYPDGTLKEALAQSYMVEGKLYHATDASHFFSMNIRAGVIIGIALLGPDAAAERIWGWKPVPDQLPKLRKLSDLYWAYWSSLHNAAGTRVDNINKYIVYSVQNVETEQIIARALRSVGKEELEPWPGHYFPVESSQGLSLLGSPIGATIGYLLMQHKKELGNKYVTGVRVLCNDEQADDTIQEADLVFHIANVPPEQSVPDAPGQDPQQGQPQSDGLVVPQLADLTIRDIPGQPVEEHVLGPNNFLRVHTVVADWENTSW